MISTIDRSLPGLSSLRKFGAIVNRLALAVVIYVSAGLFAVETASAAGIEGRWRGGGKVSFGVNSEKVRCSAKYKRSATGRYRLSATCTTGATRVSQTAVLRRTGKNAYSGTFRNSEYGVTGSISVRVKGSHQYVTLSSSSGSADLSLRRR